MRRILSLFLIIIIFVIIDFDNQLWGCNFAISKLHVEIVKEILIDFLYDWGASPISSFERPFKLHKTSFWILLDIAIHRIIAVTIVTLINSIDIYFAAGLSIFTYLWFDIKRRIAFTCHIFFLHLFYEMLTKI